MLVDENVLKRLITESDLNNLYAGMNVSMFAVPPPPNASDISPKLTNTVVEMESAVSRIQAKETPSPEKLLTAKRSGGRPSNEITRRRLGQRVEH